MLIHQPSYSMLNRWIEKGLLDELEEQGMGCIVFTAAGAGAAHRPLPRRRPRGLARGPQRTARFGGDHLDEATLAHVARSTRSPRQRGQKLAQLALQWALRDDRVTSAVIGASSVEQLDTNLDALTARR